MKIYFACSITGGRRDEAVYRSIVQALLVDGHQVPTAHLASPEVLALEAAADAAEVYQRDINWIQSADVLISEVSTPSHGVGYEISYALSAGKPVLCCYREGRPVSKMILGNPDQRLRVAAYRTEEEAVELVRAFLAGLCPNGSQPSS